MRNFLVSVPFRGSCSEIRARGRLFSRPPPTFPSPFGVRVLKSKLYYTQGKRLTVSVPFRGSCSEIRALLGLNKTNTCQFPSPFGVRVLKCLSTGIIRPKTSFCFRPLSGFVF